MKSGVKDSVIVAVAESLRIADEFVRQWFNDKNGKQ